MNKLRKLSDVGKLLEAVVLSSTKHEIKAKLNGFCSVYWLLIPLST